jgi:hypothetical protein
MLPGQLETGRASCLRAPPCRLVFENNVQRVQDTGDETCKGRKKLVVSAKLFGVRSHAERNSLPRMVRPMLISRSTPQPFSRKTPRGGRMMAKMILQMSLWMISISADCCRYNFLSSFAWQRRASTPRGVLRTTEKLKLNGRDGEDLRSGERHDGGVKSVKSRKRK